MAGLLATGRLDQILPKGGEHKHFAAARFDKAFSKQQSALAARVLRAVNESSRLVCSAVALTSRPSAAAETSTSGRSAVPPSSETARSILELVSHGTLSTLGADGAPLGTYTSFVLDAQGQPILRLRADAVHTTNVRANPRCSLFVRPDRTPGCLLARITLVGQAEEVDEHTRERAAERHRVQQSGAVGIDAPREDDCFMRLRLDHCFFVGSLAGAPAAELISAEDYTTAAPDPLCREASVLVAHMNQNRMEDVARIGGAEVGAAIEQMQRAEEAKLRQVYAAELLWVDRLGCYIHVDVYGRGREIVRVQFRRPVSDERDARSMLTMIAQVAWEKERNYIPAVPESIGR